MKFRKNQKAELGKSNQQYEVDPTKPKQVRVVGNLRSTFREQACRIKTVSSTNRFSQYQISVTSILLLPLLMFTPFRIARAVPFHNQLEKLSSHDSKLITSERLWCP